eukprot:SAG11_NODE_1175_length_5601_cov_15.947110_9_plen_78_part_00
MASAVGKHRGIAYGRAASQAVQHTVRLLCDSGSAQVGTKHILHDLFRVLDPDADGVTRGLLSVWGHSCEKYSIFNRV